jgi:quinol monooxygenase YgiN
VEWQAREMSLHEAEVMARDALTVLRDVPGLDEARIFGDFEGGRHCFLLTWHDGAAMDRYMASDAMHAVRGAALPFVTGKPSRRIFIDYGAVRRSDQAGPAPR